jgi:altronate hydrolase
MLTRASLTIRLHPNDDVVIARTQLVGGTLLADENVTVAGLDSAGHKVATRAIAPASPSSATTRSSASRRATSPPASTSISTTWRWARSIATTRSASDVKPTRYVDPPATFMGIVRPDGRVRRATTSGSCRP